MKKIFTISIIAITILIVGCTEKQKPEKLIREYMKTILNDYKSYEPVSYGTLDSLFTDWSEEKVYKDMVMELLTISVKLEQDEVLYKRYYGYSGADDVRKRMVENESKRDELMMNVLMYATNYEPEFIGYKITHKYRAKNRMGASILDEQEFHFNIQMTEVIGVKEIEED